MNNLHELDVSVMVAIELLSTYGAIDSIPEDNEAEMLIKRAEDKTGATFEGLGRIVNWELYIGDQLIAKRKPVKNGVTRRYGAVGQWLHDFVLEVEHNGKEIIAFKKKTY